MIIVIMFIALLAFGIPIAWMLGICGASYILMMQPSLITSFPQRMMAGAANYALLCIPLFILAGELMGLSGDVKRLCDLSRTVVGHIKGGLAYVTILLGTLLGAPLGSALAESALLSSSMFPELKKDGYDEAFAANMIGAVSIIGPIIPPGMTFIIYGIVANVSIQKLFMAGIMPGIYMAIALTACVFIIGLKQDWKKGDKATFREFLSALRRSAFSLITPTVALLAIGFGIATPTESAAVLSGLILFVGVFIYKQIKLKDLLPLFVKTGITSVAVLLLSDMSSLFGFALAYDRIPQTLAAAVSQISNNPYVILLIMNVIFFFVGMVMEPLPILYILVPVMIPIMASVGLDPIHIGMVLCLNLAIGLLTPPIGSCFVTTSMATGVPANKMVGSIWFPWIFALLIVLLVTTYLPGSFMWMVDLLG